MGDLLSRIREILGTSFIYFEEVAEVLAVALTARKNVILWGPGGHAKSAMVTAVIRGLGLEAETSVQSCGEGLDEAALWGGLNFRKLEDEKVLEYFPENSFLARRYAVFEELFDAPASVLLALKDTMTSGVLRKGTQQFPMCTQVIIACTNREPAEIADLGPAVAALVERFPLQLRVSWPSYIARDYLAMYEKIPSVLNGFTPILAEVIASQVAGGNVVSPRTAMYARDAIIGRAAARGAEHVEKEDLGVLKFVPGLEKIGDTIATEVEAAMARAEAASALEKFERALAGLVAEVGDTPIKALQAAKRLAALESEMTTLAVPDELVQRRDALRQGVGQHIISARRRAEELVRI
ncbi:MAG: ATPase AAA-5 domain protein [Candidatus Wolfebacteria bacterium GW2011_GWC1_43_10]|uniref:ATPase AAA-5 domain protein n=1 Tax=Candidatus Wolfebacteria bacterium GW2011_GWC1_43_10 TaxID=1619011 RepID=A0A0G1EID7_9BACT|nr:MAG: ATPase AAA-5 domain protein [Candidatus Wolfebacteria bacterium GW2011_GWC1_43_10]KKT23178.1 MAG: ATPase associated with various cellular activity [Parcubacteria group bacterium GW2011_GWB1_43_8b]